MNTADVNIILVDGYIRLLDNLSPDNKLDLISRLSASVKTDITNRKRSFKKAFGAWESKKTADEIIVNTINFGSLKHWRWLVDYYGKDRVKEIIEERWATEFNAESRNLAQLIFGVSRFRHGPRGAH